MRRKLLLSVLLPVLVSANTGINKFSLSQPTDSWTSFDKWKHFSTSTILTVENHYYLTRHMNVSKNNSIRYSVTFSFGLGLAKEVFDSRRDTNIFSWKDLVYDMAGTALGIVIIKATE